MTNQEKLAQLEDQIAALKALVQQYADATPHAFKLLRKGSYAEECLMDCNKAAEMAFNITPKQ